MRVDNTWLIVALGDRQDFTLEFNINQNLKGIPRGMQYKRGEGIYDLVASLQTVWSSSNGLSPLTLITLFVGCVSSWSTETHNLSYLAFLWQVNFYHPKTQPFLQDQPGISEIFKEKALPHRKIDCYLRADDPVSRLAHVRGIFPRLNWTPMWCQKILVDQNLVAWGCSENSQLMASPCGPFYPGNPPNKANHLRPAVWCSGLS